jgi:hypothetical protein
MLLRLIRICKMVTKYVSFQLSTFAFCVPEEPRNPSLMPHSIHIQSQGQYDKLTKLEIAYQHSKRMRNIIREPIVVTCMYNGSIETITIPANRVFDGDSLKYILCLEDDGIAWAVHDWLYNTHAFDTKLDGTTTLLEHRWPVDELMYALLIAEGNALYGRFLQTADICVIAQLDRAWDRINDNTFVEPPI